MSAAAGRNSPLARPDGLAAGVVDDMQRTVAEPLAAAKPDSSRFGNDKGAFFYERAVVCPIPVKTPENPLLSRHSRCRNRRSHRISCA